MTISREKCLDMASEAGFAYEGSGDGLYICNTCDIEALINRAYQEGAKDMRERAAKEIEDCSLEVVTRAVAAIEIRNLEID